MAIEVAPGVTIADAELELAFVRSGGPGGQNVNKVATAVQLRFDLARNHSIPERARARLRALAGRRLTEDGALLIIARTHRSQEQNRRDAEERLVDLVKRALIEPKARRATRPTRASRERRLETKQQRATTKRGRARVQAED